ncbi:hypothetical protein Q3G72_024855 [Acer saccharum]|nr:hypothetical protein Q3G72_024855 [Acer saccharum]
MAQEVLFCDQVSNFLNTSNMHDVHVEILDTSTGRRAVAESVGASDGRESDGLFFRVFTSNGAVTNYNVSGPVVEDKGTGSNVKKGKWKKWVREGGFDVKLVMNKEGNSGGLFLYWKENVEVSLLSYSRFHIDSMVTSNKNKRWRLTGFYGHPNSNKRIHGWTLLKRLVRLSSLLWLVGGDFNEILCLAEKLGGGIRQEFLIDNFRMTLEECGLFDLGFSGPPFTWSNRHEASSLVQERLDRCVGNSNWHNLFPIFTIKHLDYLKSDHRPILLEFSGEVVHVQNGHRFLYESCWADKDDCHELIQKTWAKGGNGNNMQRVVRRLSVCAKNLQRRVEKELDEMLKVEESLWKQRSRVTWMKEGDRNTRFFHAKASAKRSRNRLDGLFDLGGVWKAEEDDMVGIIGDYFTSLFNSSKPSSDQLNAVLNTVNARVPDHLIQFLDASFAAEEIRTALFQMNPTKAPSSDGFPTEFYQKFWNVVGKDLTNLCLDCLNNGQSVKKINHTLLCLISKVKKVEKMSKIRPISLCNIAYKCISKALANHFRQVLNFVINDSKCFYSEEANYG